MLPGTVHFPGKDTAQMADFYLATAGEKGLIKILHPNGKILYEQISKDCGGKNQPISGIYYCSASGHLVCTTAFLTITHWSLEKDAINLHKQVILHLCGDKIYSK